MEVEIENIPKWLRGTLIRNGSGIYQIGNDSYNHLFDGLAVLHRFEIRDGKVTYKNAPLQSDAYKKNMAANRIVVSEFGTRGVSDPCEGLFSKFKTLFISNEEELTDNCSVNVGLYGDQLYAMTESTFFRRIDSESLNTIGDKTRLDDYVAVNLATAHPHFLKDGTALNMGSNFKKSNGPHYCIFKTPPTFGQEETVFTNAQMIAEIPCRWKLYPSYYHSFGMTSEYIVFLEQPYCFSVPKIFMRNIIKGPIMNALSWWYNCSTRIHIVSIKTGEIYPIVYETDKLFTFHHANAYETDGKIILDLAGYDSAHFVKEALLVSGGKKNSKNYEGETKKASLRRYILPLTPIGEIKTKTQKIVKVEHEKLYSDWFEFPRINYSYNGVKYRYVYGCTSRKNQDEPCLITKVDTDLKECISWDSGDENDEITVSEPVFVENPEIESPDEDDGVILTVLTYKKNPTKTSLVIINAKTMEEIVKVHFETKENISNTFHGIWTQH